MVTAYEIVTSAAGPSAASLIARSPPSIEARSSHRSASAQHRSHSAAVRAAVSVSRLGRVGTSHHRHVPRPEWPSLRDEDAREQLVVLQAECLDGGEERLQAERQRGSRGEDGHRGHARSAALLPQGAGALPHQQAQRGVGQAEGGEPGERDNVGPDADDRVEELHPGLHPAGSAVPGGGGETGRGERQPGHGHEPARCEHQVLVEVPPAGSQADAEVQRRPGDARRRVERGRPATFAPPVDHAERVRAGQQERTDTRRRQQQGDRPDLTGLDGAGIELVREPRTGDPHRDVAPPDAGPGETDRSI